MIKRNIFSKLRAWSESLRRKPLVLLGARQVGKTSALLHLGQNSGLYKNCAYVNFERMPTYKDYFQNALDPKQIVKDLRTSLNVPIQQNETLIVFDEIQECPEALTSLKYFAEDAPGLHIAAAGSLLGVKQKKISSFPVGKVNFLQMYPLSFAEFAVALGHGEFIDRVTGQTSFERLPTPLHQLGLDLLRLYFFIGGMPEVVAYYLQNQDLTVIQEIHREIIRSYELDIAKHAEGAQVQRIFAVWQSLLRQLGQDKRKFKYTAIESDARARSHELALQWLCDAGIVLKCQNLSTVKLPIKAYAIEEHFKIFCLDVGLMTSMANVLPSAAIGGFSVFEEFKGALVENFVAQELMVHLQQDLFYWSSNNRAQVDFVVENEGGIFPLEVKAGINLRSKSLSVFKDKFAPSALCRVSLSEFAKNGLYEDYPLYGLSCFPRLTLAK